MINWLIGRSFLRFSLIQSLSKKASFWSLPISSFSPLSKRRCSMIHLTLARGKGLSQLSLWSQLSLLQHCKPAKWSVPTVTLVPSVPLVPHEMRNEMPLVSQSAPQVASPILPGGFHLLGRGSKTESGTSLKADPEPVCTRVHLVAHLVGPISPNCHLCPNCPIGHKRSKRLISPNCPISPNIRQAVV